MKYIIPFLMLGLLSCHGEKETFQVSSVSSECQADPGYKVFMLNLNLCKQESYNESGFRTCLKRSLDDWSGLPASCREQSKPTLVKATAFFLDKVLTDAVLVSGKSQEEAISHAVQYSHEWLSSIPSATKFAQVEGSFLKIYMKITTYLNGKILDARMSSSPSSLQIDAYKTLFSLSVAKEYSTAAQSLLLIHSLDDLLQSMEPKVRLLSHFEQFRCALVECSQRSVEMEAVYKIGQINQSENGEALQVSSAGTFGTAFQQIFLGRAKIKTAFSKLSGMYFKDGPSANSDQSPWEGSRLASLTSTLKLYRSLAEEPSQASRLYPNDSLRFGVSRNALNQIQGYLKEEAQRVGQLATQLTNESRRQLELLKQAAATDSQLNGIREKQNLTQLNMARLAREINALRNAFLKDEEEYAELLSKFQKLPLENGSLTALWSSEPIVEGQTLSPNQSLYTPGQTVVDYAQLSLQTVDLVAGESLHLDISGDWGPSCAIAKDKPELLTNSLQVGPNGYVLVRGNNSTTLNSREKSTSLTSYSDISSSGSSCINVNVDPLSLASQGSLGGIGSFSSQTCDQYTSGRRRERTSREVFADSQSQSSQINFQGGLTLPSTPFRNLPAGALIAIKSGPSGVEAKVLNRSNRIEAVENSRVYILINDCQQQANSDVGSLVLDMYRLKASRVEIGEALVMAMAEIEKLYSKAFKQLTYQSDVEAEINLLRSSAKAEILSKSSVFQKFPVAEQYLQLLLDYKTQQLVRRSKILIKNLEYQTEQVRYNAALSEQGLNFSVKEILGIELKKAISDASLAEVGPVLYQVNDIVMREILPVLLFHGEREELKKSIDAELASFSKYLALDGDIGSLMDSYSKLLQRIADNSTISQSLLRYKNQYDDLLITVPNPHLPPSKTLNIGSPVLPERDAKAMWEALFGSVPSRINDPIFQLKPDAVYGDQFAEGGISCISSKPVIEDIAFALVLDTTDFSRDDLRSKSRNKDFPIRLGPQFSFVSSKGPLEMNIVDESVGVSSARYGMVRKDAYEDAYELLKSAQDLSASGKGLSPFSSWSFLAKPIRSYVGYNLPLFFRDPTRAALGLTTEPSTDRFGSFSNEFEAFVSDTGTANPEVSKEEFPERLTDILILVRFSSLTSNKPDVLKWIAGCAQGN